MQEQLQQLLDRQACEDVLARYGRSLDWLDEAAQASCFWPEAEIDYGFFKGDAAGWVAVVMQAEAGAASRWHVCTGIVMEVEGNRARSECYGLTAATSEVEGDAPNGTIFGGRYLDEFEKRGDEWRIIKRQYIADWAHHYSDALNDIAAGGLPLNILKIAAPNHPSYRPIKA